ncbi:MAG: membrane-bound PQQ-dependent dehydrogenase, glucose/quinate/shikimate family, partial [Planctomycetota bacterium]
MFQRRTTLAVLVAGLLGVAVQAQQWPHYAGDLAASHYSPLDQITAANVGTLQVAWEWKPNEKVLSEFGTRPGAFQNTPLMIDGVLYV